MTKLIKTTLVALILAATLVAFRGPGPRQPASPSPKENQVPNNKRQQQFRDPDTLGREVDIDSARDCVWLFKALAAKSRLTAEEEKRYPNFHRSRVNTTGEVFSSRKLIAWLESTDSLYSAQMLTMHLNVQLGIYTEEYLRTYHREDERLRKKLLGRVGIFIIPLDSASKGYLDRYNKLVQEPDGKKLYSKASVNHGPNPVPASATATDNGVQDYFWGGGGKGYDLGGIQP